MIRAQEEQIAVFEPERVRVQTELDALINPSSAEATARAENQLALAQLALERLECDRALADVIRGAKGLLEKREEMTSKVWGLARKLDMMLDPGGIDKDVVAELENVLRYDLAGQSESWVSWLLGAGPKTEHSSCATRRFSLKRRWRTLGHISAATRSTWMSELWRKSVPPNRPESRMSQRKFLEADGGLGQELKFAIRAWKKL